MKEIEHEGTLTIGHNVQIGYFAQNQASLLDENLTVFQTIDDVAKGEIRNKIRDLLGAFMFGGPEESMKKGKVLSGGERTRLAMIKLLLEPVNLLILDEPTAGLDVIARDELLEMLREFLEKDEERSILISSHISSDLESLCDDLYMIHDGKIILHEDTDVLLSDYALLKVDAEQYSKLDKQFILRSKKETYGYSCLTNQKQYYMENYPKIAIEKGTIDEVITMMIRGTEQ